jgi:hypothetical protein
LIDPLAFIPPAELAPDAATETTLDALKSKFDTPLVFDKAGLATITGQAAIAHAIADKPPTDVSALAKDTTLGQLKTSLEFAGWGKCDRHRLRRSKRPNFASGAIDRRYFKTARSDPSQPGCRHADRPKTFRTVRG